MTRLICFLFLLLSGTFLSAQDAPTPKLTMIQANLNEFNLMHERSLGNLTTIQAEVGLRYNPFYAARRLVFFRGSGNSNWYTSVTPRVYINRQKRLDRGRSVANNSGSFLGLQARFDNGWEFTDEDGLTFFGGRRLSLQPHWGMRRQLGKRFHFDLTAGVSASYLDYQGRQENAVTLRPTLNFKFGFRL